MSNYDEMHKIKQMKHDIYQIMVILTWFNSADFGKVELQILAELNFTILWLLTLAQLNF